MQTLKNDESWKLEPLVQKWLTIGNDVHTVRIEKGKLD